MAKFSDRLGITQAPQEIQIESMNNDLRNSIWNWFLEIIKYDNGRYSFSLIWKDYLKRPLTEIPSREGRVFLREIQPEFMKWEWYDVYNFVEFIYLVVLPEILSYFQVTEDFFYRLNQILERELSGYRLIDEELTPISAKEEVEAIREAMTESDSYGLEGVSIHIKKALSLLSKKPDPDYANSIKESISAVESVCKLLSGESSGGIDKALTKLADQVSLHPALKRAFSNLYGYTSDESGIRHAILEMPDIGFAEAKFMLVTCSAFVNFVVDKARTSGVLLNRI